MNDTGLTLEKLRRARAILDAAPVKEYSREDAEAFLESNHLTVEDFLPGGEYDQLVMAAAGIVPLAERACVVEARDGDT